MKEEGTHRNNWPIGRVMEAIQSEDGQVRKARVEIIRDGKKKAFLHPIKELVVLVPAGAGSASPALSPTHHSGPISPNREENRNHESKDHDPWPRSVTLLYKELLETLNDLFVLLKCSLVSF